MSRVTLEEFQKFAQPRLTEGLNNPLQFRAKLGEVFDFAKANEGAMDEEANAYFDNVLNVLSDIFERGLDKVADSSEKRKMARAVALTKQKHHRADKLAEGLGRPLPRPFAVAVAAKPVFFAALQSLLDVLYDATRQPQNGLAQFGVLSMLYWTVDELNVAFYLAERKYATQAYSHIRMVYDLLEKVELLFKQPQWAEVWAGDDRKQILKKLSPASIREKLGRPRFDVAYSFLSEIGSHGTFEGVRRRVVQKRKPNERPEVGIWLGGVPWDNEVVVSVSFCVFAVISTLIMAIGAVENRLNSQEALEILNARSREAVAFLQEHFVSSMKESMIDVSELLESLKMPPVL
jgi:hypothetical protein